MRRDVTLKMLDISEAVLKHEEYGCLLAEYRRLDKQVLKVYQEIQPRQRDVLMAYMGVLGEMNMRLLEEACREALESEARKGSGSQRIGDTGPCAEQHSGCAKK